jgi:hypothetical protein
MTIWKNYILVQSPKDVLNALTGAPEYARQFVRFTTSLLALRAKSTIDNLAGLQELLFDQEEFVNQKEQASTIRSTKVMFPSTTGG